jgi:hypothetical protein
VGLSRHLLHWRQGDLGRRGRIPRPEAFDPLAAHTRHGVGGRGWAKGEGQGAPAEVIAPRSESLLAPEALLRDESPHPLAARGFVQRLTQCTVQNEQTLPIRQAIAAECDRRHRALNLIRQAPGLVPTMRGLLLVGRHVRSPYSPSPGLPYLTGFVVAASSQDFGGVERNTDQ